MRRAKRIDQFALDCAERHDCKAAALMAGVEKILTDFVGNQSWGTEITIDTAIALLSEARDERREGVRKYQQATLTGRYRKPAPARGRRPRATNKKKAGSK